MKNLIRWGLAGATAMALLVPGRAEAQFLSGTYYGGSNFQTGFEIALYNDGGGLLRLEITNVGNMSGDFAGFFKGIGLANVPVGVTAVSGGVPTPDSYSFESSNSVSGDGIPDAIWAWYANAPPTENGLNLGESGTFYFLLSSWDDDWMNDIGVAVHSIGAYGCSTKFAVWDGGTATNDAGPDYDPSCIPVPEPGTNALLAIGLFGMAFVAVRRKSLSELLGRA